MMPSYLLIHLRGMMGLLYLKVRSQHFQCSCSLSYYNLEALGFI
jgi:hypothetical protein